MKRRVTPLWSFVWCFSYVKSSRSGKKSGGIFPSDFFGPSAKPSDFAPAIVFDHDSTAQQGKRSSGTDLLFSNILDEDGYVDETGEDQRDPIEELKADFIAEFQSTKTSLKRRWSAIRNAVVNATENVHVIEKLHLLDDGRNFARKISNYVGDIGSNIGNTVSKTGTRYWFSFTSGLHHAAHKSKLDAVGAWLLHFFGHIHIPRALIESWSQNWLDDKRVEKLREDGKARPPRFDISDMIAAFQRWDEIQIPKCVSDFFGTSTENAKDNINVSTIRSHDPTCLHKGTWDKKINRHKVPWEVRSREEIFFSNSSSCEYIGEKFHPESVQYFPAQRLGEIQWQAVIRPPKGDLYNDDLYEQKFICHEKKMPEPLKVQQPMVQQTPLEDPPQVPGIELECLAELASLDDFHGIYGPVESVLFKDMYISHEDYNSVSTTLYVIKTIFCLYIMFLVLGVLLADKLVGEALFGKPENGNKYYTEQVAAKKKREEQLELEEEKCPYVWPNTTRLVTIMGKGLAAMFLAAATLMAVVSLFVMKREISDFCRFIMLSYPMILLIAQVVVGIDNLQRRLLYFRILASNRHLVFVGNERMAKGLTDSYVNEDDNLTPNPSPRPKTPREEESYVKPFNAREFFIQPREALSRGYQIASRKVASVFVQVKVLTKDVKKSIRTTYKREIQHMFNTRPVIWSIVGFSTLLFLICSFYTIYSEASSAACEIPNHSSSSIFPGSPAAKAACYWSRFFETLLEMLALGLPAGTAFFLFYQDQIFDYSLPPLHSFYSSADKNLYQLGVKQGKEKEAYEWRVQLAQSRQISELQMEYYVVAFATPKDADVTKIELKDIIKSIDSAKSYYGTEEYREGLIQDLAKQESQLVIQEWDRVMKEVHSINDTSSGPNTNILGARSSSSNTLPRTDLLTWDYQCVDWIISKIFGASDRVTRKQAVSSWTKNRVKFRSWLRYNQLMWKIRLSLSKNLSFDTRLFIVTITTSISATLLFLFFMLLQSRLLTPMISAVIIKDGSMYPAFSPDIFEYNVYVDQSVKGSKVQVLVDKELISSVQYSFAIPAETKSEFTDHLQVFKTSYQTESDAFITFRSEEAIVAESDVEGGLLFDDSSTHLNEGKKDNLVDPAVVEHIILDGGEVEKGVAFASAAGTSTVDSSSRSLPPHLYPYQKPETQFNQAKVRKREPVVFCIRSEGANKKLFYKFTVIKTIPRKSDLTYTYTLPVLEDKNEDNAFSSDAESSASEVASEVAATSKLTGTTNTIHRSIEHDEEGNSNAAEGQQFSNYGGNAVSFYIPKNAIDIVVRYKQEIACFGSAGEAGSAFETFEGQTRIHICHPPVSKASTNIGLADGEMSNVGNAQAVEDPICVIDDQITDSSAANAGVDFDANSPKLIQDEEVVSLGTYGIDRMKVRKYNHAFSDSNGRIASSMADRHNRLHKVQRQSHSRLHFLQKSDPELDPITDSAEAVTEVVAPEPSAAEEHHEEVESAGAQVRDLNETLAEGNATLSDSDSVSAELDPDSGVFDDLPEGGIVKSESPEGKEIIDDTNEGEEIPLQVVRLADDGVVSLPITLSSGDRGSPDFHMNIFRVSNSLINLKLSTYNRATESWVMLDTVPGFKPLVREYTIFVDVVKDGSNSGSDLQNFLRIEPQGEPNFNSIQVEFKESSESGAGVGNSLDIIPFCKPVDGSLDSFIGGDNLDDLDCSGETIRTTKKRSETKLMKIHYIGNDALQSVKTFINHFFLRYKGAKGEPFEIRLKVLDGVSSATETNKNSDKNSYVDELSPQLLAEEQLAVQAEYIIHVMPRNPMGLEAFLPLPVVKKDLQLNLLPPFSEYNSDYSCVLPSGYEFKNSVLKVKLMHSENFFFETSMGTTMENTIEKSTSTTQTTPTAVVESADGKKTDIILIPFEECLGDKRLVEFTREELEVVLGLQKPDNAGETDVLEDIVQEEMIGDNIEAITSKNLTEVHNPNLRSAAETIAGREALRENSDETSTTALLHQNSATKNLHRSIHDVSMLNHKRIAGRKVSFLEFDKISGRSFYGGKKHDKKTIEKGMTVARSSYLHDHDSDHSDRSRRIRDKRHIKHIREKHIIERGAESPFRHPKSGLRRIYLHDRNEEKDNDIYEVEKFRSNKAHAYGVSYQDEELFGLEDLIKYNHDKKKLLDRALAKRQQKIQEIPIKVLQEQVKSLGLVKICPAKVTIYEKNERKSYTIHFLTMSQDGSGLEDSTPVQEMDVVGPVSTRTTVPAVIKVSDGDMIEESAAIETPGVPDTVIPAPEEPLAPAADAIASELAATLKAKQRQRAKQRFFRPQSNFFKIRSVKRIERYLKTRKITRGAKLKAKSNAKTGEQQTQRSGMLMKFKRRQDPVVTNTTERQGAEAAQDSMPPKKSQSMKEFAEEAFGEDEEFFEDPLEEDEEFGGDIVPNTNATVPTAPAIPATSPFPPATSAAVPRVIAAGAEWLSQGDDLVSMPGFAPLTTHFRTRVSMPGFGESVYVDSGADPAKMVLIINGDTDVLPKVSASFLWKFDNKKPRYLPATTVHTVGIAQNLVIYEVRLGDLRAEICQCQGNAAGNGFCEDVIEAAGVKAVAPVESVNPVINFLQTRMVPAEAKPLDDDIDDLLVHKVDLNAQVSPASTTQTVAPTSEVPPASTTETVESDEDIVSDVIGTDESMKEFAQSNFDDGALDVVDEVSPPPPAVPAAESVVPTPVAPATGSIPATKSSTPSLHPFLDNQHTCELSLSTTKIEGQMSLPIITIEFGVGDIENALESAVVE